jgi:hypothetical protein
VGQDRSLVLTVAALEPVDRAEPRLERGKGGGVVVDALGQLADLGGDVRQFRLQPGESLRQRLEPRIQAREAARLAQGDRRGLPGTAALGREGVVDRRRSPGDRLAMLSGRKPRTDLVRLARAEPCRGDLAASCSTGRTARLRADRSPIRRAPRGSPPALDHAAHGEAGSPCPPDASSGSPYARRQALVVLAMDLEQRPDASVSRDTVVAVSSILAVERHRPPLRRWRLGARSNSASTRAT